MHCNQICVNGRRDENAKFTGFSQNQQKNVYLRCSSHNSICIFHFILFLLHFYLIKFIFIKWSEWMRMEWMDKYFTLPYVRVGYGGMCSGGTLNAVAIKTDCILEFHFMKENVIACINLRIYDLSCWIPSLYIFCFLGSRCYMIVISEI